MILDDGDKYDRKHRPPMQFERSVTQPHHVQSYHETHYCHHTQHLHWRCHFFEHWHLWSCDDQVHKVACNHTQYDDALGQWVVKHEYNHHWHAHSYHEEPHIIHQSCWIVSVACVDLLDHHWTSLTEWWYVISIVIRLYARPVHKWVQQHTDLMVIDLLRWRWQWWMKWLFVYW